MIPYFCSDRPLGQRISRLTYEAMKLRYLCILDNFCVFRVIIWGFFLFALLVFLSISSLCGYSGLATGITLWTGSDVFMSGVSGDALKYGRLSVFIHVLLRLWT